MSNKATGADAQEENGVRDELYMAATQEHFLSPVFGRGVALLSLLQSRCHLRQPRSASDCVKMCLEQVSPLVSLRDMASAPILASNP